MANGQQIAEENIRKFNAWVASKNDDDFRTLGLGGALSRKDIADECQFSKSVLAQNPRVKGALKALEDSLRERGVLPPQAVESDGGSPEMRTREPSPMRAARDAERLSRLEQENASLRAEAAELKRQLSRYRILQEALAETGRLPR